MTTAAAVIECIDPDHAPYNDFRTVQIIRRRSHHLQITVIHNTRRKLTAYRVADDESNLFAQATANRYDNCLYFHGRSHRQWRASDDSSGQTRI